MEWSDEGIVLSARKHGETSVIVNLLTRDHGRHAGLVRGGTGTSARGLYQPGNRVAAVWRARLAEHLGSYRCELTHAHAAEVLDDPAALALLGAACAVAEACLPEREPHPRAFEGLAKLVAAPAGAVAYVAWELDLLAELGFGLDLSACAATGGNDQLAYVSPKSGRAVSRTAGEPYKDLLLPLPGFLTSQKGGDPAEVLAGLRLTGYFLERHVLEPHGRRLPDARTRLVDRFARSATISLTQPNN